MNKPKIFEFKYPIVPLNDTIDYFPNLNSYDTNNELLKDTVRNTVKRETYDIIRKEISKLLLYSVPKVGNIMTKAGFSLNRFGTCMYNEENLLIQNDIYSNQNVLNAYSYCGKRTLENLMFSKININNNSTFKRLNNIEQFLEDTPFEQRYNFTKLDEYIPWYNVNNLLHYSLYFTMDKLNYIISPIETLIVDPIWNNIVEPIWDRAITKAFTIYDDNEPNIRLIKHAATNFGIFRGGSFIFALYQNNELLSENNIDEFDTSNSICKLNYDYNGNTSSIKKNILENNIDKFDTSNSICKLDNDSSNINEISSAEEGTTKIAQSVIENNEEYNVYKIRLDQLPNEIIPIEKFTEFMNITSITIAILNGFQNWDNMNREQQARWLYGTTLSSATMIGEFRKDIGDFGSASLNIISKLVINEKLRIEEVAGFMITEITNFFKVSLPFSVVTITNLVTAIITNSNMGMALCDLAKDVVAISIPVIGQIYGIYKILTGILQLFNTYNVIQTKIFGIDALEIDVMHKNLILADDYNYTIINTFFDININVHSSGITNHQKNKKIAQAEFIKLFKANAYVCTGFTWQKYVPQDDSQPKKTLYQQYVDLLLTEILNNYWNSVNNLSLEQIDKIRNLIYRNQKCDVNIFDYLILIWNNWKKYGFNIFSYIFPNDIVKAEPNYWDRHKNENIITFIYNLYILWKTGNEANSDSMTPEQYQALIIELNTKRTQQQKDNLSNFEQQETEDSNNGKGKYSRFEIMIYANKKQLEYDISIEAMAQVGGSTVVGSLSNSIVYIDQEIKTINYIGIKKYLKSKIKSNVKMYFENYSAMVLSSHATLSFCLSKYSETFTKEFLDDYIIPHIALTSNLLVSNINNREMDKEDRIYNFFEGIFKTNIGKLICFIKKTIINYFSITTDFSVLILNKLAEYGIILNSFVVSYIPILASMIFYRIARKVILNKNNIPNNFMNNIEIQTIIDNQSKLILFENLYNFVSNKKNNFQDRQIAYEKILSIQQSINSKFEYENKHNDYQNNYITYENNYNDYENNYNDYENNYNDY